MTGARKVSGRVISVICLLIGIFFCWSMVKGGFSGSGVIGALVGFGGAVFLFRRTLQGSDEDEYEANDQNEDSDDEEDDSEW